MKRSVVILANGAYPEHEIPRGYIIDAERIICCDGAVAKLVERGLEPWAIVGDLDSVPPALLEHYADRMYRDEDQDTNDLTKAVRFAVERGFEKIFITGASGVREDHSIANISLLLDYAELAEVMLITDYGIFIPVSSGNPVKTRPGQQISVFSGDPDAEVTSAGLKYPLRGMRLASWWSGTLNEATGESVTLTFNGSSKLLIFLVF